MLLISNRKIYTSRNGTTLVELLVVVSIIVILTAAILPGIRKVGRNSNLDQASDIFVASIELVRSKSVSGQVINPDGVGQKVWWGVECDSSNSPTTYDLGYMLLDSNNMPVGSFVTSDTVTLSGNTDIVHESCNTIFLFKRVQGDLRKSDGTNISSFEFYVTDTGSGETKAITVNQAGKVSIVDSVN